MLIEHEWDHLTNERCIHCGTLKQFHETKAQNCVPRWSDPAPLGEEPGMRVYAVDDRETIHARMIELEADRLAIRNTAAEPDEIAKIVY